MVQARMSMGTWLQTIPKDPQMSHGFGNSVGSLESLYGNMVTKDPKRSHGFGNTVGYVECLYGHMVREDPQKILWFWEFSAFCLECPWEHGYERSHGFGNFIVFIWNVHGNMVINDLKVLRIL